MGFFHGVVIERGAKKKKKREIPKFGEGALLDRERGRGGLARGPGGAVHGPQTLPMSLPTGLGWRVTLVSGAEACITLGLDSSRPTSTLAIHPPHRLSDASGNLGFCHCRLCWPEELGLLVPGLCPGAVLLYVQYWLRWLPMPDPRSTAPLMAVECPFRLPLWK